MIVCFVEYPAFVVMMLREILYGIELNINSVVINPFPMLLTGQTFYYNFGNLRVNYSQSKVELNIPGDNNALVNTPFELHLLLSEHSFTIEQVCNYVVTSKTGISDASGVLRFELHSLSNACDITISSA